MRIFQEKNEMINPKGKAWKPIKEGRRREEERKKQKKKTIGVEERKKLIPGHIYKNFK